ncbi:MAG TPA: MFS transporter [Acidimicrobiales bacterium]
MGRQEGESGPPGGDVDGTAPPAGRRSRTGLLAPERRALTVGLVLTVTVVASEALAVVTVMPLVTRDLGGLRLYGWVFSAFLLGSMVGIVAAGREADRSGPARPFVAGLVLFAAGLTVAGAAPAMGVLVAGRLLQGLGAGAVPAVAYVAIGRAFPEALQARMMAVLSTAWVVPGIVGPLASAAVAHVFGWRWVFLGLLPLVAATGVLALPGLVRLGRPDAPPEAEHRMSDALRVAAGTACLLGGLTARPWPLAVGLVVVGTVVAVPSLNRLLPAGSLRARPGLPATILSRGLLTFAFFGADAFVTLAIVTVRHHSLAAAGVAVTASTLAWAVGAWIQARLDRRWEGRRLVRLGLALNLVGIAGMLLVLDPAVPVAVAVGAWATAGLGMGLSYAPITLMMLRHAPEGREGWASASLSLSDVLGAALGAGFGGAAIAAGALHGWPLSTSVAIAFALPGAVAVVGLVLSGRLPSRAA